MASTTDAPANHTRRRTRAESGDANQATSEDATGQPMIKAPKVTLPFKVDEDDLKCVVCLEFPVGKIVQCPNGHLLCDECHDRVIEAYQCVCPTCRAKLSRDRPSRNRFAESILATIIVPCTNAGCMERLAFGKVRAHASELCPFRIAHCKFAPLGCDWKDYNSKLKAHQRECTLRQKSAKSILKRVLERATCQKQEERRKRAEVVSQIKIAELLSSRCRDILIREVVIERDTICEVISSKPFKAFGATLSLELDMKPKKTAPSSGDAAAAPVASTSSSAVPVDSSTPTAPAATVTAESSAPTLSSPASSEQSVSLFLTQRSRRSQRMRMTAFLLKGPDSEIPNFTPVIVPVQFTRTKRTSDPFPLPLTAAEAKDMFEMGSLTVRIGLVDRRRGVSRSFSSEGSGRNAEEDGSFTSSSDDDDDGIISEDGDAMHYYSTSSDEDDDCIHTYMDDDDDHHHEELTLF
uniref:TRAF-type domain-containing protein n=1 Tax=Spongospora subterranea TaxID=70186 RepID=A0A0H5RMJ3_9EUKA|eukprot:CRZ09939.1 hypothetical protein [Spongospora subterranea]